MLEICVKIGRSLCVAVCVHVHVRALRLIAHTPAEFMARIILNRKNVSVQWSGIRTTHTFKWGKNKNKKQKFLVRRSFAQVHIAHTRRDYIFQGASWQIEFCASLLFIKYQNILFLCVSWSLSFHSSSIAIVSFTFHSEKVHQLLSTYDYTSTWASSTIYLHVVNNPKQLLLWIRFAHFSSSCFVLAHICLCVLSSRKKNIRHTQCHRAAYIYLNISFFVVHIQWLPACCLGQSRKNYCNLSK